MHHRAYVLLFDSHTYTSKCEETIKIFKNHLMGVLNQVWERVRRDAISQPLLSRDKTVSLCTGSVHCVNYNYTTSSSVLSILFKIYCYSRAFIATDKFSVRRFHFPDDAFQKKIKLGKKNQQQQLDRIEVFFFHENFSRLCVCMYSQTMSR